MLDLHFYAPNCHCHFLQGELDHTLSPYFWARVSRLPYEVTDYKV